MTIERLLNVMRMQSQAVVGNTAQTRFATVSSYDPNNYAVKVLYQPDNTESGWLPIGTSWAGNGWGMFSPPPIGTMVKVSFQEGNHEAGIVSTSHFNDGYRPLPVPSGEMWLVHGSGSSVKILNDGSISITGNTTITGDLHVTGNISDGKDSMEDMRTIYNSHVHGGSPPPTPTMPT